MPDPYVGEIRLFAGTFAPVDWALCDGQELQVESYPELYVVIGNTYGGSSPTTFRLPDLAGRVAVGQGQAPGMSNRRLGQQGGAERVSVSEQQLPVHSHDLQCTNELAEFSSPRDMTLASGLVGYAGDMVPKDMYESAIGVQGEGEAHYNLQPFMCLSFIIALTGRLPFAADDDKELG